MFCCVDVGGVRVFRCTGMWLGNGSLNGEVVG